MRFAPSAILSILVSRRLLLPVDVLTSSIVSMALTPSNKREKIKGLNTKGLSLRDKAQPFCVLLAKHSRSLLRQGEEMIQ